MSDPTQPIDTAAVVKQTILSTVEALAPVILASTVVGSPAAALLPVVTNLVNAAIQAHNAGALSAEQLSALFVDTGKSIQDTHLKWIAMNAAETVKNG